MKGREWEGREWKQLTLKRLTQDPQNDLVQTYQLCSTHDCAQRVQHISYVKQTSVGHMANMFNTLEQRLMVQIFRRPFFGTV